MAFLIGKLTRKVSKQYKEFFVGKFSGIPVVAFWGKKGQEDLCLFLDTDKINFLANANNTPAEQTTEPETQPQ